ncbi:signal transduction histidine kinase [Nocardiopsis sp. Huas11]|uniref:HAMP domain-containing sensor histidine kinase n=1 Tax=Nocardiopsis sp. Huas11 TaxID=2183912 RepID=UPI000F14DB23|nr:HAMP domain-containing sensor histidine kinase [Nocardiopsis sp. Huas11]RKS07101.1 signal transduction histidine kinase [Nocardiopsis sp. Huas11]
MVRRLLTLLLPVVFVLVAAVAVPIGTVIAHQRTQDVYVDRLADASRFASLARTALEAGREDALAQELERYRELYDTPVAVVSPAEELVVGSEPPGRLREIVESAGEISAVRLALAGERPGPPATVWPWTTEALVVAEPIGRDSEVEGAIVVAVSPDGLRASVLRSWGWLALISLAPLVLLAAAAMPLSRWVLRPIGRLDAATTAVTSGDLEVHVDAERGPPELRRLTESFNTMVAVVRGALERQRSFVSEASHQLRNPLASLRLAVENLAPHLTTDDAREAHAIAVDETMVMHRMLNSLLAATRLESITGTDAVEVAAVVDTRVSRWRALGDARGFTVATDVPAGVWVQAPAGGLGSILDELFSNAIRLSRGTRVEIRLRSDGQDGVGILVLDDGEGLPEEEREAALARFWRSSRHQNTEGTGLGLAIVADLVRQAGGRLALEEGLRFGDRPGFGVVITLPRARARDDEPDERGGAGHRDEEDRDADEDGPLGAEHRDDDDQSDTDGGPRR